MVIPQLFRTPSARCKTMVWLPALAVLLSPIWVLAQDPGPENKPGEAERVSMSTSYVQRGNWLAQREEVVWFGSNKQFWMVTQTAKAAPVGEVLMVSNLDPNGVSQLAQLRLDLTRMGWRTHFVTLPTPAPSGAESSGQVADVFTALRNQLPASERLFVICEGHACLNTAQEMQQLPAKGLVFINIPVFAAQSITPIAVRNQLQVFQALSLASLVLQEHPNLWPVQQPLASDVELHLLPRSNALRSNSRILRKFRGWLKRRHQIG